MRVTKGTETLKTAEDKNALRFEHLRPLDLYRYANGGEQKVYMKLTRRHCMCIAGGRRAIFTAHPKQVVIQYSEAQLDIGNTEKYALDDGEEITPFDGEIEGEDSLEFESEYDYMGHPQDWI